MPSHLPVIEVEPDCEALHRAASDYFCARAAEAIAGHGQFTVALSGGSTPRGFYALLANPDAGYRDRVAWDKIHFFWGDERHVPPDSAESNFRMANEAMLSVAPVPKENIHRIPAEMPDAEKAAKAYEDELRRFFTTKDDRPPRLDLALMGMGPDGHTASLFPQTAALHENKRWVVRNWVEKLHTDRITLAAPVLCNSAHVLFLVAGADKAVALRDVLHGPYHPDQWPAQIFRNCSARVVWLIDQLAARQLPKAM